MPARHPLEQLGRRERQIMDILFRKGRASAAEVQAALDEPISNSGVRGMLRYLASKGYVAHEQEGPRYVYFPVDQPEEVSRSALRHLVSTFFRNSPSSAMAAILDVADTPLSEAEYQRLSKLLEQAREPGEEE
ncbi:MAG TPA: BlaI/MecI/CopY family transcriptional regulator [Longimicrobium sp.]